MRYVKLPLLFVGLCLLLVLTWNAARAGTGLAFAGIVILYAVVVWWIERYIYPFVTLAKPRLRADNYSVEEIRERLTDLFNRAKRYVDIVSGRLWGDVYASQEVVEALGKAVDRGVIVEIITEEDVDPDTMAKIEHWVRGDKILLYKLPKHTVSRHFAVVDGSDVRIEEKHKPDDKGINALYWYATRKVGNEAKRKFEEIKKAAIPVTFEK